MKEITKDNSVLRIFLDLYDTANLAQMPVHKRLFITDKYLIRFLKDEFDITINHARLNQLIEQQLLTIIENNKNILFTLDSIWKIKFLEESKIEAKFPFKYIQQLNAYFDTGIIRIISKGFENDKSILTKAMIGMKKFVEGHDLAEVRAEEIEDVKSGMREFELVLRKLQSKGWASLSGKDKELINLWIQDTQQSEEIEVFEFLNELFKGITAGYSPQVKLSKNGIYEFKNIDWSKTINQMEINDYFDFLDTPQFSLNYLDGEINIKIKVPGVIDSKAIRKINLLYTRFLKKTDRERKAWGENSGRSLRLQARNDELIRLHEIKFKSGKYPKSLDFFIDEVIIPYCESVGLPIGVEGVMKIIYKKEYMH